MRNMKKYIVLALVLLVAGSAFAGNKPRQSSRQEMGINGNAVYVIEYTYDIHGGRNGGRQLICIDSITFDKRGNFQDKYRTKDGEYTWYSYYFDVHGYALGWNEYNRAKELTGRTAYLNDENGNRIERKVFMGDHMTKKETSRYENNRLVEEQSFAPDGTMTEKRVHKYDAASNGVSTMPTISSSPSPPTTTTTTTTSSSSPLSTTMNTSTGNTVMCSNTTKTTTGCAKPSTATTLPTKSSNAKLHSLSTKPNGFS